MKTTDLWGCPVTADSTELELIEAAVADYVVMAPDLGTRLGALAEAAPLGTAMAAMFLLQSHKPGLVAQAQSLAAAAEGDRHLVTGRERAHLDAAVAWAGGDTETVVDAFDAILDHHPHDLLALRSRYLLLFSQGRVDEMLATVTRARPHWSPDLPLASYLDGMESFAREEAGQYRQAEPLGRRGVEQDPTDLWAIHAVSHVLEMEGRREEGIAWHAEHADAMGGGGFAGHLWWHWAIQLWATGHQAEALELWDTGVYPGASEEGLDLSNAIALLARLESTGTDVGDRWTRLAGPAGARIGQHTHPFNDTHFAFGLARAGAVDRAHRLVEGMRLWSRRDDTAAAVLRAVGVEVAEGMVAAGTGQWAEAVAKLEPALDQVWRLGGSNAQRFFYSIVTDWARSQLTP